jgi:malate/lactate dehydrogenase
MFMAKKIAIIGVGSIGLSLLHFLQQSKMKGNDFEIILFHEK